MKKVLFSLFALGLVGFSNAQIIFSENFETLTAGNLGTDVTGNTAGQNSWYTLYGSNSDYQIATIDASHGKSLNITGYNSYDATTGSTLNTRIAALLSTNAPTPAVGNNILQGKFELYTGAASGGTGQIQMRVWGLDGATSRTIGGFLYNVATGELRGLATVNNTGTGTQGPTTYSWGLAATPGVILTPNTWVTLSFQYNMTTGAFTFFFPGGSGSLTGSTTYSLISGMTAKDLYLYNVSSTGNIASKTAGFDNFIVQYSNAAALSTIESEIPDKYVRIFPNPVSDILNIVTKEKINSLSIFDMSGRRVDVNVKAENNQVNVQNLQSGTYIINIETTKGKSTQKFIKK